MPARRKKSTTSRSQSGAGLRSALKKIHSFVKDKKLISVNLRTAGYPNLANAAAMMGYGKKRRTTASTRRRTVANPLVIPIGAQVVPGPLRTVRLKRGRTTVQSGNGFIGKTIGGVLGGLAGGLLPF